ncbi:GerMN domain-containing protein [Blastococcus sp. TML/M2B]|nr:GerMN domain-containing protein [Blastococcus sp. TML/M2B]MBN1093201.1 GerMN domain-containing protein [Blastococcus sp. TML/M2B]
MALAACGVPTQDRPESLVVGAPARTSTTEPVVDDGAVELWFIRGRQLEAVSRPVGPADVHAALDLLVAGLTPSEVDAGLRTALAPQTLRHSGPTPDDPSVTVTVTREFTGLLGGNQQLAVAQIVWTVTEFPGVDEVRFSVDGSPLEVPTDDGLTDEPVDRADYGSVAPR